VQKDLDIAEYTDLEHNPMIPHTLVLEPGLIVHKIYYGYWFFGRPTIEEHITNPEMKAAWQRGDQSSFWPYGKNYADLLRVHGKI
jgi:hypothetical protein